MADDQSRASGDAGRNGISYPALIATKIAKRPCESIDAETDIAALTYTGEHEDYFFYVEAELRRRLGDLGGALHTARSRATTWITRCSKWPCAPAPTTMLIPMDRPNLSA